MNFCEKRRGGKLAFGKCFEAEAGRGDGTVRLLAFGIPKSPYFVEPFLTLPPVGVTSSNVKVSVVRGVNGASGDAGSIKIKKTQICIMIVLIFFFM